MGTYIGSPWGQIRGKVDDCVGGVWKGINWLRVRVLPTQLGTIEKYRLWKDDNTQPFSFKQFNIKRLITQILGYIARFNPNLTAWIRPVWNSLVTKRGWTMTGTNAFVKRNAAVLFASMPDNDAEYHPTTNAPDLLKMLVADGDLEEVAAITTAAYDPLTGTLDIAWDDSTFTNGDPTDTLQAIIAKKPLLEMEDEPDMTLWNWYPKLHVYTFLPVGVPIAITRSLGATTITLPIGLDPADLILYIFFRDDENLIGYSQSKALQIS